MRLRRARIDDRETWNRALSQLPQPHALQTWEWGAFKSRHGWETTRFLWQEGDKPRAAASVLRRRLGPLGLGISYVPKGPALDYDDEPLLKHVLDDLEGLARRARSLFIKIDPDVEADAAQGEAVTSELETRGWRFSEDQIQFRNTMVIDLTPELDDLLMAMKSKWRYNVRLAKRKGVSIREGGLEDLGLLYEMYAETAERNAFIIRPRAYYEDAWRTFIEAGRAQPFIAEVEGEPVAMVILFHFEDRAWYMYGASRTVHRDKMPNHRLQWRAMDWAKAQGCTVYDMWGAPDELDESDPMWGVYRFKKGFGSRFRAHIGAWDFPASPVGYWLYTRAMPRVLEGMRWLHHRRET